MKRNKLKKKMGPNEITCTFACLLYMCKMRHVIDKQCWWVQVRFLYHNEVQKSSSLTISIPFIIHNFYLHEVKWNHFVAIIIFKFCTKCSPFRAILKLLRYEFRLPILDISIYRFMWFRNTMRISMHARMEQEIRNDVVTKV